MNNNFNNTLSSFFKPFINRIREILSNTKKENVQKIYSKEEYDKDIDLIKSAFDKDLIDLEEYNNNISLVKAQYNQIDNMNQDYADAIIKNNKGEILLLRRAITDIFCPDCWSLPGGKIEVGEKPEEAVIREVKEETNLNITNCSLILKKKIDKGFIYYFSCEISEPQIILDPQEHISSGFFNSEGWSSMNLILDLKTILNDLVGEVSELNFPLFPSQLTSNTISQYSNIEEQIAMKDIFMLTLFTNGDIDIEDYVDYVEKAYKDDLHKDKLIQLKGKTKEGGEIIKWATKKELERLAKHAKNTSHKNLETVIKESAHPKLREFAHAELKRREDEEKNKEEKKGYEAHEYHGKEFKYNKEHDAHLDEDGNKADLSKLYSYYNERSRDQDNQLKQLRADLEGSSKQKQALGNKLKKAYYQKIAKTRFAGDEEFCYKTAISKLEKMGMTELDIEPEKIKKIINKKISIKKSEDNDIIENASTKAKRIIEELKNNKDGSK